MVIFGNILSDRGDPEDPELVTRLHLIAESEAGSASKVVIFHDAVQGILALDAVVGVPVIFGQFHAKSGARRDAGVGLADLK